VNPYVKVLSCLPELALELGAPALWSCRDVHAVYHEDVIFYSSKRGVHS
jgi:hypothetical protein